MFSFSKRAHVENDYGIHMFTFQIHVFTFQIVYMLKMLQGSQMFSKKKATGICGLSVSLKVAFFVFLAWVAFGDWNSGFFYTPKP